jgi:hypothetical protein
MKLRISTSLVVLLALLLMLPATSVALRIDPDSVREVIPAASPSADDGGAWEVGAHAAGGDLYSYAYSEASNLYSRLGSCGWNRRYLYGAGSAWEEDFKRSAAGGTESSYLDTASPSIRPTTMTPPSRRPTATGPGGMAITNGWP